MNRTSLKNFLGIKTKEVDELIKKWDLDMRKSFYGRAILLQADMTDKEITIVGLSRKGSHAYWDTVIYLDEHQNRYYPSYWTNYFIPESEVITVQVYDDYFGQKEEWTSQRIIDKYNIKKCSVCGCYETSIRSKRKTVAEYDGAYYCPKHLPEGTARCCDCGEILKKEDIVPVYKDKKEVHYYDLCSDCVSKQEKHGTIAKCVDDKYYASFGVREGKYYPLSEYFGLV